MILLFFALIPVSGLESFTANCSLEQLYPYSFTCLIYLNITKFLFAITLVSLKFGTNQGQIKLYEERLKKLEEREKEINEAIIEKEKSYNPPNEESKTIKKPETSKCCFCIPRILCCKSEEPRKYNQLEILRKMVQRWMVTETVSMLPCIFILF